MSFASLSNTLDDVSAISSLNLTKNPFDSAAEAGQLNLPSLSASPSIFLQQSTPGSQKKKGFRWSIDQISKLNPADIEEFPNQEYSSTFERQEDEEKAQKAINEYFSHGTILPSPWTPENHVKHVTFSPHPPSTTYISGDEDSMTDAGNISNGRDMCDACCQTSLTFPPSFDLSKIVDSGFFSYVEDEGNSANKDLNVSSLRRKLFSPDDEKNLPVTSDRQSPCPRVTRSILKSSSPMNLLTSSPTLHRRNLKVHYDSVSPASNGASSTASQSPGVSPISAQTNRKSSLRGMSRLKIDGTISTDEVFKNDVLESSDICIDPQLIPDISPIKNIAIQDHANQNDNIDNDGPMRVSERSHMIMDIENDFTDNVSSVEMDITEPQPLTSTQRFTENTFEKSCATHDKTHDVIDCRAIPDVVVDNMCDVITEDVMTNDVTRIDHIVHKINSNMISTGLKSIPVDSYGLHKSKDGSCVDDNGYAIVNMDSLECSKENMDTNQRGQANVMTSLNEDEALVQRACAAIERADRVVRESCAGQMTTRNEYVNMRKYVNSDRNHVDKSWNHVNNFLNHGDKVWYPISMSTPLVNDKPEYTPLDRMQSLDRSNADIDSYKKLLSSFANSKLEQYPRGYSPENYQSSLNRAINKKNGARSISNSGNSNARISLQDTSLSSRSGYYSGLIGKRFSWPLWQTSRNRYRYLNERNLSPTIPRSHYRRRSTDDWPRMYRSTSEDLKRYSRVSRKRDDLRRDFRL